MTSLAFGDVILVPFPFTNQAAIKRRPAVVISSAAYHRAKQDVLVMAVTSQVREPLQFGESLIKRWKSAGLLKPSVVKPVIATLDRQLVIKRLGSLCDEDLRVLDERIETIFGSKVL